VPSIVPVRRRLQRGVVGQGLVDRSPGHGMGYWHAAGCLARPALGGCQFRDGGSCLMGRRQLGPQGCHREDSGSRRAAEESQKAMTRAYSLGIMPRRGSTMSFWRLTRQPVSTCLVRRPTATLVPTSVIATRCTTFAAHTRLTITARSLTVSYSGRWAMRAFKRPAAMRSTRKLTGSRRMTFTCRSSPKQTHKV
jgi:hypothetical protein